jgi:hypothetical protein
MRRLLFVVLWTLLLPGAVAAQEVAWSRFLLPFFATPVPGAHGSLWEITSSLYYAGEEPALVFPRPFCYAGLCLPLGNLEPALAPVPVNPRLGFPGGLLLHVEAKHAGAVTLSSRIRDLSRTADSAGTEVPVVPEAHIVASTVRLPAIPHEQRFRLTLRIYALPEAAGRTVEVRYYRHPADEGAFTDRTLHLLRVEPVQLRVPDAPAIDARLHPAYAQLGNIESLPELQRESLLFIEIVPQSPDLRIWAFASVTNNETQQVTLITPMSR